MLLKYWSNNFYLGLLIFLISAVSLSGALLSQYGFNMHPCLLCLYQRGPHAINLLLGILALSTAIKYPKFSCAVVFTASIAFLLGGIIATYHVGVEQLWWHGFEGCSFPKVEQGDFEGFKNALLGAPVTSCTDIPFELFGISMAGYNALLSLGSAAFFFIGSILSIRRINGVLEIKN